MRSAAHLKLVPADLMDSRETKKNRIVANANALLTLRTNTEEVARLMAYNCALRGYYWLNSHAPVGWLRRCLGPKGPRAHVGVGTETILGCAYEYDTRMSDCNGYSNDLRVMSHYGISYDDMARLGFYISSDGGYRIFADPQSLTRGKRYRTIKRYQDIRITNTLLTEAWRKILTDPPGGAPIQHKHSLVAVRRKVDRTEDSELSTNPTLFQLLDYFWHNIIGAPRKKPKLS